MKELDLIGLLAVGILTLTYLLIVWEMMRMFGVLAWFKKLTKQKRKKGVVYIEDYRRKRGK